MITKKYKLPLDALQLKIIRGSDNVPRNKGILELVSDMYAA